MICALTVRTLKPGTFDQFREAFMRNEDPDNPPAGWVRFDMVRNVEKPDEVICFGFYDGTAAELRAAGPDAAFEETLTAIGPYVESVGTDGLFDVIEEYALH